MSDEPRKRYQDLYPTLDSVRLEKAAGLSFSEEDLDHLSAIVANYMHDLAGDFELPSVWVQRHQAPLPPRLERENREWLIAEVGRIWRSKGGTGRGGYYSDLEGQHTGPLLDLITELLDQAGAPAKGRSRHTLFRAMKNQR